MTIPVVWFAAYLTRGEHDDWKQCHYNANAFIHALKDEDIRNRYADIEILGARKRLTNQNRDDAVGWFAELAANYLSGGGDGFVMVPIPGRQFTVNSSETPRTADLAVAIVKASDRALEVLDALRWCRPMPSTRHGEAPREARFYFDALRYRRGPYKNRVEGSNCVLVDDVVTTGAHIRGAAAFLERGGAQVLGAICGGRTVHEVPDNPFGVNDEEFEEFLP